MINQLRYRINSILAFIFLTVCVTPTAVMSQPAAVRFQNVQQNTDTLFEGNRIVVRNAKKDTIEIAGYKNGLKHGKQIIFSRNGIIISAIEYKKGLMHGKAVFYTNKNIIREEHYKSFPKEQESKLHGKYKKYASNEVLLELYHYKNGLKTGKYKIFHTNGKLREKGTFKENLNIGEKTTYTTNGTLQKKENYKIINNPDFIPAKGSHKEKTSNGGDIKIIPTHLSVLDGKAWYYYSNGQTSLKAVFNNGKKEGAQREFYNNPENVLKSEVFFKNGLKHGAFVYYFPSGNLEKKGAFYRELILEDTLLKNVYEGKIEMYQANGELNRVENWKNYKKNGPQETYFNTTGELSTRIHFVDNLKSGVEERFDQDGNKSYEAFFEIVEKDGHDVSQQTGIETNWSKGQVTTLTSWKDGKKDGITKTFYKNGQVERLMHFREGNLSGPYQTFFENGKLREDYNKFWPGYGNSKEINWNTVYDKDGNITRKFFADEKGENIISMEFENGVRKTLVVNTIFSLNFSENANLSSVHWLNYSRPSFGYDLFSNLQLRKLHFQISKHPALSANFTKFGDVIQIVSVTGAHIEEANAAQIAEKIAKQINPDWNNEALVKDAFPNGTYQWQYTNGNPFFDLTFKDNLPHGEWIVLNPILNDTLFYAEFENGLPIGKLIRKRVDGTLERRLVHYSNHKVKEAFRYTQEGFMDEVEKKDSLGNRIYLKDHFDNGRVKSISDLSTDYSVYLTPEGDTASINYWQITGDSIRIERQFFPGNKLKVDRINNAKTGWGSIKTYFENGQLKTSHELKNNQADGVYKRFDENGDLLTLGHFKDKKRHGRWTNYLEDGTEETSHFEQGEIILKPLNEAAIDANTCRCYDTTLAGSKIGFANSLDNFADYKSIKPFIPKSILPISEWHYDRIFYVNLITDNDRNYGATQFKLLLFNDFSFHYPVADYLRFNLNPCKTEGYIGNIQANVSYNFEQQQLVSAYLATKRIAVSLDKNPLVNAQTKGPFTGTFDTESIYFDEGGIQEINFSKEKNECFPKGLINNLMEIQIQSAQLTIQPNNAFSISTLPLLNSERQKFYGFDIDSAQVTFQIDSTLVEASCDRILAGANFVAGRLLVFGTKLGDEFYLKGNQNTSINLKRLQIMLEQKGFYRIKVTAEENQLIIEFYTEK